MNNIGWPLIIASWQTVYMVYIAGFLSISIGLWLGVLYFFSGRGQIFDNALLNNSLGFIINVVRSIPFIILLISIIPLTRLLVGTSIGTNAAIVPLMIAAIPFYARITENALRELPLGLIETAHAIGATHWQLIVKVLLPEAMPALIRGASLTIISLIGYSAMAGVVGGGGLGELAINYGYQRFDAAVMLETVVLLVIIVQFVQWLGDTLATKKKQKMVLWGATALFLFFMMAPWIWTHYTVRENSLKVGIIGGPQEEVMHTVQKVARDRFGLDLKLIVFNDYVLPNTALNNGSIDANIFQHIPYLKSQSAAHGYRLIPIAKTFVYPFGFYSARFKNLHDLSANAIVAIPNDPSNEGRALLLLEQGGLIKLKPHVGLFATPRDIVSNPLHLQFKLLDAAQLPRVLHDADLVGLTNDYIENAGFTITDALLKESANSPYVNIIAIRASDKNRPEIKELVEAFQSPQTIVASQKVFAKGGAVPGWSKALNSATVMPA